MKKISVGVNRGSLMIQFMISGQRYSLYGLGDENSKSDRDKAELLARVIQGDILENRFDSSLERYRSGIRIATRSLGTPTEMFAQWMEHIAPNPTNYRIHYEPILRALVANTPSTFKAEGITKGWEQLSSHTHNERIGYLKRFGKWLVEERYLTVNPYKSLKNRDVSKRQIKPFTANEVASILAHIEARNPMIGAYYRFLFLTGCRPCEAIGLRWSDVDEVKGLITISSALVRDHDGSTTGSTRIRKSTKTGDIRTFPISNALKKVLLTSNTYFGDIHTKRELVFVNSKGQALDDGNLLDRYWKIALKDLGIEYRKPYITRHTAASTVIENGGTLADAAKLLGHKDLRMVASNYGHAIKDVQLPDYSE